MYAPPKIQIYFTKEPHPHVQHTVLPSKHTNKVIKNPQTVVDNYFTICKHATVKVLNVLKDVHEKF